MEFDLFSVVGTSNYNPYVRRYDGNRECENGGGGRGGRGNREGESGETGDGDEEGDEGWDDELEAAELASFQESLSVSEMEWVEEEDDDFETASSRVAEGEKSPESGGTQPPKTKQPPQTSLPTRSCGDRNTNRDRVVPLVNPLSGQQQSTTRAIRTVVKRRERSGELANHLAQVTDSPATVPIRRPSGQSIYKAPGQQDPQPQQGYGKLCFRLYSHYCIHSPCRVPKTAKRVRFRY